MTGWSTRLTAACAALASGGATVVLICAALAGLLAVLLILGFGPLHPLIWPAYPRRSSTLRARWDGGLASVWQLYRQTAPRTAVRQHKR